MPETYSKNNTSTLNEVFDSNLKVAVNSLQRTLFVERIHVDIHYPTDRIIPYDVHNLYPNKIKSIAERSGTALGAIETLSNFSSGEGFQGMDLIVNRDHQTMWDILRHISHEKAMFKGWALHFNYNVFGQIAEITPINFEFIRWSKDLKKLVVSDDWAKRRRGKRNEISYDVYNPDKALEQMEVSGGINQYKGQILYWIPRKSEYYTTCNWDSVIDDAQLEAEAKLYGLSSIQNDYSLSGLISYPKNLPDQKEIDDLKIDLKDDTGSKNAGGIRVISALPTEGMAGWKWFTPISRNNIDSLFKNQIETAKFNIYAGFRQPPILNGVSQNGMFNEASFADAFNYYNSSTETDRKEIERELNKIMEKSIWPQLSNIQIQPKKYVTREAEHSITQKPITNG